jgi:hypothetical protein
MFKKLGKIFKGKAKAAEVIAEEDDSAEIVHIDAVQATQAGGDPVAKCGYVWKRGGMNPEYKKRWFVMTDYGRVLYFLTHTCTKPLGQFVLEGCLVEIASDEEFEFKLNMVDRTWFLKVTSEEVMVEWINTMNHVMAKETDTKLPTASHRGVSQIETSFIMPPEIMHSRPAADFSELKVCCITWNLSEHLPQLDDIKFMKEYRDAQIIVIGCQECQPVVYSAKKNEVAPVDVWQAMTKSCLGKRFSAIAGKAMGAIHINVYVRDDLLGGISDVNIGHVACGLGNVMFNKGAVGISCVVRGHKLAFVCAHLAARIERVPERKADFIRIDATLPGVLGCIDTGETFPEGEVLGNYFDAVFMLGDFNYRIEGDGQMVKNLLTCYEAIRIQLDRSSTSTAPSMTMADKRISSMIRPDSRPTDTINGEELRGLQLKIQQSNKAVAKSSAFHEDEDEHEKDDEPSHVFVKVAGERGLSVGLAGLDNLRLAMLASSIGLEPPKLRAMPHAELSKKVLEVKEVTDCDHPQQILDVLLENDQLRNQMVEFQVFKGFREHPIRFKPSYKFDPGTETYDTSKKNRAPAWCDRVLFKNKAACNVDSLSYECVHGTFYSDHRAVVGNFRVIL